MKTFTISDLPDSSGHSKRNPRVTAFVYPKIGQPVRLQGLKDAVTRHILKKYPVSLVHFLIKRKGSIHRDAKFVRIFGISRRYKVNIFKDSKIFVDPVLSRFRRRRRISIIDGSDKGGNRGREIKRFVMRRFPRSWMPELNQFIDFIPSECQPLASLHKQGVKIGKNFTSVIDYEEWWEKIVVQHGITSKKEAKKLVKNTKQSLKYEKEDV